MVNASEQGFPCFIVTALGWGPGELTNNPPEVAMYANKNKGKWKHRRDFMVVCFRKVLEGEV
jgi:hypothetical protein